MTARILPAHRPLGEDPHPEDSLLDEWLRWLPADHDRRTALECALSALDINDGPDGLWSDRFVTELRQAMPAKDWGLVALFVTWLTESGRRDAQMACTESHASSVDVSVERLGVAAAA